ncbi:hypothetical protein A6J40_03725 [Legionella longbeachae]|uniref:Transmembrane protein n=1 Tax=Legionella longbeachae serogroup 1 (strain NSW150) TaxID=661367 RepID=D3HSI2_LEGLN|nr:hypothetical protein A6J40_03725 [Legionella longbeachae]EEZ94995.1 conserved hypothetical protein [Legionella longbeachae D-4968]CBJ11870.1 hypothetical protein LLO_1503 [Legionella longbeachae NSW150]VEE02365.1 Uncharacterised protein [Legionella oakridgensis]HBD7398144.1 hypothetical protein [Legionella pneumophila]
MSLLFDLVIEPKESKTYLRLVLIIYLFTVILILYSSIYLFLKFVLIGYIAFLLRLDWINRKPSVEIKKIQLINNQWVLDFRDGKRENYLQATILINNVLFSLIQLTHSQRKKCIILFHDQLTATQLRFLYFKTQD